MTNQQLIEGLVGAKHRERYMTNPWFQLGVDELARLLPFFVEGLALQADEANDKMQRDTFALSHALPFAPLSQEEK